VAESLAAGADGTGTQSVTIPRVTPSGSYYLLACVDYPKPGWVRESNEENNCLASQSRLSVDRPDLTLVAISTAAASVPYGGKVKVTDTARNAGLASAVGHVTAAQNSGPGLKPAGAQSPAIVTRYFLSTDLAVGDDVLIGSRQVTPGLAPGASDMGTVDLVIPSSALVGTYFLGACIDANGVVAESNEQNNCLFAPQRLIVRDPQPGDS
jgi:subtilase family serine protease